MRYDKFYTCPYCGAALDPGEKCDCENEKEQKEDESNRREDESNGREQSEHQSDQPNG